jgi:hypothetical protein
MVVNISGDNSDALIERVAGLREAIERGGLKDPTAEERREAERARRELTKIEQDAWICSRSNWGS